VCVCFLNCVFERARGGTREYVLFVVRIILTVLVLIETETRAIMFLMAPTNLAS
jgi:hypothetical protein